MSHYSKIFNKVPVEVFNKSGFDLSHENLFTTTTGTITPVLVDELIPNDTVTLGVSTQIQLPPMASDFYGRVQGSFYAFFVPNRTIFGGWQDFITHISDNSYPAGTYTQQKCKFLPYFILPNDSAVATSLADYLGVKCYNELSGGIQINNPLPFLAYHKIYDDWFRDSRLQVPLFAKGMGDNSVKSVPYYEYYGDYPTLLSDTSFVDGTHLFQLRQANWDKDYFVNATTRPQSGDESRLSFAVDEGSGSFSIASLRAANSLQMWAERNQIGGYRYGDNMYAQFGIYPSDATTNRALYLGSWSTDVYNKSVYQTASSQVGRNPFKTNATKFASSQAVGNGSLVPKFTATEHGIFMVVFVLRPQALYSTGTRRYLTRQKIGDFAWPLLANVGDQEIYNSELNSSTTPGPSSGVFGYTQRYAEYKYMDDEVHGNLRDGQNLSAFALQRSFNSNQYLGSDFIKIPTDYLDQVTGVQNAVSLYGCWVDSYFAYKKSSVLPAYSIPTLGDLHNTHTITVDNGGKRL